jgi:glycosyltransferase involved in cell wall biosynthesis
MDIAFFSGLFPKEQENEILKNSIGRIDFAANKLQWSLVKGMDSVSSKPIKLFNAMYVGSFPFSYKKILISQYEFSHNEGIKDVNIGFINLLGVKFIFKTLNIFFSLRNWAKNRNCEKKVLLIYAIHSPFLIASFLLKKIVNPNLKLCIIVPDLPHLMSFSGNKLYRFLKYCDSFVIKFTLKYIDAFVLLNEAMVDKIGINKRPWLMIEGIYSGLANKKSENIPSDTNTELRVIMYSGNLDHSTGVMDLISAFSLINESNYRLWITGNGDCLNEIILTSQKDNRISYFSKLSDLELQELQNQATVLVNPQTNTSERDKYFFPSKTLEYLASGRPVLMHRLPCIPIEYNEFLHYFEAETVDSIKKNILEICELDQEYLRNRGKLSQSFILNNKNPNIQCEKIIKMLKNINYEE